MTMPILNTFLGCMSLETGGLVIGWLSAICYFFSFLAGFIGLIVFSIFDCKMLNNAVKKNGRGLYEDSGLDEDGMFICSFGRAFLIVFCAITIMLSIGFIVISYLCIKGTHRRNHIHVKPMMILQAVLTALSFFGIFQSNFIKVVTGLVETIINGYLFIVLYSLYKKFLNEFTNGPTAYFQAPVSTSYIQAPVSTAYFQAPGTTAYMQAPGNTAYIQAPGHTAYIQASGPTGYIQGPGPTGYFPAPGPPGYFPAPGPPGYFPVPIEKA